MSNYPTSQFNYRVYYEHTDGGGVVYHSRYLNFFERARTDWLRERGIVQSDLQKQHNMVYAVTKADIRFNKPARMDDSLTVSCQLIKARRASVEFYQEMHNQEGVLLSSVVIMAACIKADTFSVMALPKQLREDLIK
jgi:acyl-CoA thioester hydrolase